MNKTKKNPSTSTTRPTPTSSKKTLSRTPKAATMPHQDAVKHEWIARTLASVKQGEDAHHHGLLPMDFRPTVRSILADNEPELVAALRRKFPNDRGTLPTIAARFLDEIMPFTPRKSGRPSGAAEGYVNQIDNDIKWYGRPRFAAVA